MFSPKPFPSVIALTLLVVIVPAGAIVAAPSGDEVVATALFHVSSEQPSIFETQPERFSAAHYAIFKKTQLALLRSHFVLSSAIRNPKIAASPILASVDNPTEWLLDNLQVTFPQDSEVLAIQLRGSRENADELVRMVDAVARAYEEEILFVDKQRLLTTRDLLARSLENINSEIRREWDEYLDIAREAGRSEADNDAVLKSIALRRLKQIDDELMRLETKLTLQPEDKSAQLLRDRIAQLTERQADLERKIAASTERSIELESRAKEIKLLQRIAERMSVTLETMDIEAAAPPRIRQIQPAIATPAN